MTLERIIHLEGFAAQCAVAADLWIVISGQAQSLTPFQGVIDPQPWIDPRTELGPDVRELGKLYVARGVDPGLESQDMLCQTTVPGGQNWKVVRQDDNTSDTIICYWIVKVIDGVDSI